MPIASEDLLETVADPTCQRGCEDCSGLTILPGRCGIDVRHLLLGGML